jgi:hypothetical protein
VARGRGMQSVVRLKREAGKGAGGRGMRSTVRLKRDFCLFHSFCSF